MLRKNEDNTSMRRGVTTGVGEMPGGMAAELTSGAIGGSEADGMPVASMNAAGPTPNANFAGMGPLREMPAAGTSPFREMPPGGMGAGTSPEMNLGASAKPGASSGFAEMPRAGASPAQASDPPAGGAIVLAGEWRLQLTVRGQPPG